MYDNSVIINELINNICIRKTIQNLENIGLFAEPTARGGDPHNVANTLWKSLDASQANLEYLLGAKNATFLDNELDGVAEHVFGLNGLKDIAMQILESLDKGIL